MYAQQSGKTVKRQSDKATKRRSGEAAKRQSGKAATKTLTSASRASDIRWTRKRKVRAMQRSVSACASIPSDAPRWSTRRGRRGGCCPTEADAGRTPAVREFGRLPAHAGTSRSVCTLLPHPRRQMLSQRCERRPRQRDVLEIGLFEPHPGTCRHVRALTREVSASQVKQQASDKHNAGSKTYGSEEMLLLGGMWT